MKSGRMIKYLTFNFGFCELQLGFAVNLCIKVILVVQEVIFKLVDILWLLEKFWASFKYENCQLAIRTVKQRLYWQ